MPGRQWEEARASHRQGCWGREGGMYKAFAPHPGFLCREAMQLLGCR